MGGRLIPQRARASWFRSRLRKQGRGGQPQGGCEDAGAGQLILNKLPTLAIPDG
jgi:hypothetical protein